MSERYSALNSYEGNQNEKRTEKVYRVKTKGATSNVGVISLSQSLGGVPGLHMGTHLALVEPHMDGQKVVLGAVCSRAQGLVEQSIT